MVLNKLLDGFEGKLTTTKWAKLTKSSQDPHTATSWNLSTEAFSRAARKEVGVQAIELVEFAQASKAAKADEEPKKAHDRADEAK